MDSEWIGAVRLFSGEIPLAKPVEDPTSEFPLSQYQTSLKSVERGMWASGNHGAATQVVWLPRPGSCLVSTFDGAIMQLTQNVLDESPSTAPAADAKPGPASKAAPKEAAKKPTFSKVLHRHTDSVCHMKVLDNPGNVPYVVTSTTAGQVTLLDLAGGKVSTIAARRAAVSRCTALAIDGTTIAASFDDHFVHLFDSQLATTAKIASTVSEDPIVSVTSSGHLLALGTLDQHLVLFDVRKSAAPLSKIVTGGAVRALSFNSDATKLATGSDDGHVQVFDIASNAITATPTYDFKHGDRVTALSWSPETTTEFVTVAFDGLALRHQVSA